MADTDPLAAAKASLAALAAQGGGGSTHTPNFIGVPTYDRAGNLIGGAQKRAQGPPAPGIGPPMVTVPYRYVEGQEWSLIGTLTPSQRADLQGALAAAGLYSSKTPRYTPGVWDNDTAAAFRTLLANANATGDEWGVALDKMLAQAQTQAQANPAVGDGSGGGSKRAPLSVSLTNPDDLVAVLQKTSKGLLGRKLSDTETKAFVDSYHKAERDYQAAAYAVTDPNGAGGAVTQAPDASVMAETQLRSSHQAEAGANDLAGAFDNFQAILDGRL